MRHAITVRTPAKVNLDLSVGPRRADGFHDLVTVFHAVSIFDDVVAHPAEPGSGITLDVVGDDSVPTDASNLAVQAAVLLAQTAGVPADVALTIRKQIPVAGGMAGGSADAAAALVACDALWQTELPKSTLAELAAQLGSDVPFALHGGTAIGTGRGEQLTPALARGTFHWVFAVSYKGLSTPLVYAECDRLRGADFDEPAVLSPEVMGALRNGDAVALGRALENDLQRAAITLRPDLGITLEVGDDYGALGGIVSGSGPTCAFLVRDEEHALDLSVALSASGVADKVLRAHGPVPGARVL